MGQITGWDVGGAHLKAALIEDGDVVDVEQYSALIWTDLEDLKAALGKAMPRFGKAPVHAVTMTGELAEYFGSRVEGVRQLSALMSEMLRGKDVKIYAGRSGFVAPGQADQYVEDIASANWYATASVVGPHQPQAILIDIGSSTTDVIPVYAGKVAAAGYSDAERLSTGELLYTGAVRTPLMAVCDEVPFEGAWHTLMAERFAVMADVYRVLRLLPEDADMFPAVDDGVKDYAGSVARMARMVGREAPDYTDWQWIYLARFFADAQMRTIEKSVYRSLSRHNFSPVTPVVGAGAGRFIAEEIARRLDRPYVDFARQVGVDGALGHKAAVAAPAVAVGMLADGVVQK